MYFFHNIWVTFFICLILNEIEKSLQAVTPAVVPVTIIQDKYFQ